jgi:hypothetical protein
VSSSAIASPVASESFQYNANSSIAGQGTGSGFSGAWTEPSLGSPNPNSDPELVVAPSLSSPNYSAIGNRLRLDDEQSYVSRPLSSAYSTGQLWISFLIRKDDQPARAGDYGGMTLNNGSGAELFIGDGGNVGDLNYVIEMTGGSPGTQASSTAVSSSVTQLVVGVQFDVSGVFDAVRLYINPNPGTFNPAVGFAAQKLDADIGTINGIAALSGYGASGRANPTYSVDEIRLGTSYLDVVPEPSSIAAIVLGAGSLLARRRRPI